MTIPPSVGSAMVPSELRAPWWVYGLFGACGLLLFVGICCAGTKGLWWLAGLIAFFSSYGVIAITRGLIDGRALSYVFSPKVQFWTMLLDPLLAIAIMLLAYGRSRYLNASGWYSSWIGPAMTFSLAMLITVGWRLFVDEPTYAKAGALELLHSPASLGHLLTTFPALAGSLIYFMFPILLTRLWTSSVIPYAAVMLVVMWGVVGGIHDKGRRPDGSPMVNVREVHNPFNYQTGETVPSPSLGT